MEAIIHIITKSKGNVNDFGKKLCNAHIKNPVLFEKERDWG